MNAIVKKDFKSYFSTPLGYLFCALFAVVINVFFSFDNLRGGLNNIKPLISSMIFIFSLLVPLLTMRTFSEEYKLRTDQLLLTAPVSTASVVLAKFFSVLLVCGVALLFTLPYPVIIAMFGTLPTGEIAGCYIGMFFAVAGYIAIGIFISSLTENQIMSAIISFVIFLMIPYMDYLYALDVPVLNYIARLLNYTMRYNSNFVSGIITLPDMVYYLSVIAIFLFLTTRILEKKRYS